MRRIEHVIAQHATVAVRLHNLNDREPVAIHCLACRLKAMGKCRMLPIPTAKLSGQAALGFLAPGPELNRDVSQLICVGLFQSDVKKYLRRRVKLPMRLDTNDSSLIGTRNALVFADNEANLERLPQRSNVRVVHERELRQRHPAWSCLETSFVCTQPRTPSA